MRVNDRLILLLCACGLVACDSPSAPEVKPESITIVAGDAQEGAPSDYLPTPPKVSVIGSDGKPLAGVLVTFTVEAGGGAVEGEATTGGDGSAEVVWRLGPLPGENRLTAVAEGLAPVTFTATGRFLTPIVLLQGTVDLPQGSPIDRGTLRVVSGLTDVPVQANGAFTAAAEPVGTHFATVVGPDGNPLLFGWLDGEHRSFSPRTTAEVLVYFDLAAYVLVEGESRLAIRNQLAGHPALAPLESAVAAALSGAGPGSPLERPSVTQARIAVLQAIAAAAGPGGSVGMGIIIEPGGVRLSGVEVGQTGLNNLIITNNFRRRVAAFVDRVSFVPRGGQDTIPAPLPGQPIRVDAVTGATSPITAVVDYMVGKGAWVATVNDPIETPLFPADALSTKYRVVAVGAGANRNPDVPLTPLQQQWQTRMTAELIFFDVALPLIDQMLSVDNLARSHWGESELESLFHLFFDFMPTGLVEAMNSGNVQAVALETAKLLAESGPGQELLAKIALKYALRTGVDAETIASKAKSVTNILTAVEVILSLGDLAIIGSDVGTSLQSESWEVTATGARVILVPEFARISQLEIKLFEARVVEAFDGPSPVFHYRWSTTGKHGKICSATAFNGGPGCGTSFTSSREEVSYAPDAVTEGTDEIRVEVYIVVAGEERAIGEATASVTVYGTTVSIEPGGAAIYGGESATFQAVLDIPPPDGGLSYRWTSPESFGTLSPASGSLSGDATVTYTARSGVEGTDQVTVEVFDAQNRSLGSASASVSVLKRDEMVVHGAADIQLETYMEGNNERYCLAVFVTFPLVEGARQYEMYAYDFNDPYFWGTEIRRTFIPPFPQYSRCDGLTSSAGASGADGDSAYYFFLGSGSGPASGTAAAEAFTRPRFESMKVDVIVRF